MSNSEKIFLILHVILHIFMFKKYFNDRAFLNFYYF